MKNKKVVLVLLTVLLTLNFLNICALAAEGGTENVFEITQTRATGRFDIDIDPGDIASANTDFYLQAGESVTINASYSPTYVDIDFGLIGPDGRFHCISGEDGSFNRTINISERGYYTFAIQNNSSVVVSVSGFINY